MITFDSKIKEVYANPVGHDILRKVLLQMGIPSAVITNPVVGNMKLSQAKKFAAGNLSDDFWQAFIDMLNLEKDVPASGDCAIKPTWWKEANFYQIYPRSFCDSNGDGMGDLPGIISKLDYLKTLGVTALWLSPIYDSPCDDNGYDIRDYHKILDQFGTMEDFDRLLEEAHARGMRLIMDLVVNHTSDEHPWFQAAIEDPESPYAQYYIFRDGTKEQPPTNWTSFFSGPAWNYYEDIGKWGMHLFSSKQMDLNWENPAVRADVCAMIRWWLEKGVDGFRMDVINYISKNPEIPQGDVSVGELMGFYGIEHYFYGPRLHEYMRQLRSEAFAPYDAFTVGETPGIGMEMGKLLTGDDRGEMDMMFNFDHLENPGKERFDEYRYDLNYWKAYMIEWMEEYGNHCWMSLFYDNHDNPRMISKVDPDPAVRIPLAKLLGLMQFTMKGTPFIFQGQEIGAVNVDFKDISEFRDVESINKYKELCETMSEEEAFRVILAGSRDHARVMMNWDETVVQKQDRDLVYYFYKRLMALRQKYPVLVYGDVVFTHKKEKDLFTYFRTGDGRAAENQILREGQAGGSFYVECNLSEKPRKRPKRPAGYTAVLSNYGEIGEKMQPYEACLYYKKADDVKR